MHRISKILIANRGEIAVRVMRTARSMGISSVAVFSDADESSLHVRAADEAVRIGPAPARESYLDIERILAAAKRTGADAVHPGYGFLSEREEFARAVQDAGLVFIGPSPQAIAAMGLKREAKQTAREAGVPVVPGYDGREQSLERLSAECERMGFPVLIKASAGGGGKGMRICRRAEDVPQAIESAKREALAAFADDTLILERYVERPRHIEIQILGDQHGNLVHLFERECSIQRRHQKIIEETPSCALTPELREQMGAAAVAIGQAIGYSNAGTVEFIVDQAGKFYFLEVNTRLQVEHPITECVTGLDLVREQIRVARGEPLAFSQADVRMQGAALECRLYAEDPAQGFLPQSGKLVDVAWPSELPWLRVDSGVETGAEVGIHYDPMLAKVIVRGSDRSEAIARMAYALERISLHGLAHNRDFLLRLLEHPEYAAGRIHTHFIDEHMREALQRKPAEALVVESAIAAALFTRFTRERTQPLAGLRGGFRNNFWRPQQVAFRLGERRLELTYVDQGQGRFRVTVDGGEHTVRWIEATGPALVLEIDGLRRSQRVIVNERRLHVQVAGDALTYLMEARFPDADAAVLEGGYVAPMPGKIVKVEVLVGQAVKRGQRLLVMEAMKMEHTIVASSDGVLESVAVEVGQQVDAEQVLVVVAST